jgi:hypothetical protein
MIMGALMPTITNQLKNLILSSVQYNTGKFLKNQFKEKCTEIIRTFIIDQLKGRFAEYLAQFIMTYVESNIDKILDNKTTLDIAGKITNKIIRGLGTYIFKQQN